MKVSYEGIGQMVVTAELSGEVRAGAPVAFTDNQTVSAASGKFDGVLLSARAGYGAVAVRGFCKLPCTGAVALGRVKLVAEADGTVKTGTAGNEVLVVAVENNEATILL